MSVYYPEGCEENTPEHLCSNCSEDEHGRVRAAAFIHKSLEFIDPTNPQEWIDGIDAGLIIIIPETNGTFDGGTPKEGPGYGDQPSTFLGSDFSAQFKDPNYKGNALFYNNLNKSRIWKFAYKTESLIHITKKTAFINAKNGVADDINSTVVWDVNVKWADKDVPMPYEQPDGIFVCFQQA